jgi:hypothetical protein
VSKQKVHDDVEFWIDLDDKYHPQISHYSDSINGQENQKE